MDATVKIDLSSPQAISFLNYAETLPFVAVEKRNGKTFEEAVAECDGRPADEFFDELRKRVKEHFKNAKSHHSKGSVATSGRTP